MDDPAKRLEKYTNMFLNGKLEEGEYQILKNAIMSEINTSSSESGPTSSSRRTSSRLSEAQIRTEQASTRIDDMMSSPPSDFFLDFQNYLWKN